MSLLSLHKPSISPPPPQNLQDSLPTLSLTVLSDNPLHCEHLRRDSRKSTAGPVHLSSLSTADGLAALLLPGIEGILVDIDLHTDVPDTLRRLTTLGPDTPILVFSHSTRFSPRFRYDIVQAGADELVTIGDGTDPLFWSARYAVERHQRRQKDTQSSVQARSQTPSSVTMVQEVPEALIILDQTGRVTFMNPQAEDILGRRLQDASGQPFDLPVNLTGEDPQELTMVGTDGEHRHIEARIIETRQGDVPAYIATLNDVTVRRMLQKTMKKARHHTEEMNRRTRTFFSNVNHDLRTPLTHIIGFSELMRDERFGPLGQDRYKGYASDIHSSGKVLMDMIEDLLSIADAETDVITLTNEICSLPRILEMVFASQKTTAQKKGITWEQVFDRDVPGVRGDSGKLRQGLFRMLTEVLHCAEPGTHLLFRIHRHCEGLSLTLAPVPDAGDTLPVLPGIENQSGADDENSFVSAQDSGTPRQHGLSLTFLSKITELHGGTLDIRNADSGKQFQISLMFPESCIIE